MKIIEARKLKLKRLKRSHARVLDIFSGCGGLSLGFYSAGFQITGGIECDSWAAKSFASNFFKKVKSKKQREIYETARDINEIEPQQVIKEFKVPENAVDIIIGGPPCQSFARIGRAKLREVMGHPEAFKQDPRSNLYLRYLNYVKELQPLVLLLENVPDVLNYGGHNIAEEICEALTEMAYVCRYTLLNSAYYGIPQMRERLFIIAYAEEIGTEPLFPDPTHWIDLPKGYNDHRKSALKSLENKETCFFVKRPSPFSGNLFATPTTQEAIDDLPSITCHLTGGLKPGPRKFDVLIPYPENKEISGYAQLMKNWPEFENSKGIKDHVIRYLPRDYEIFKRMSHGDQYPEAHKIAWEIFKEKINGISQKSKKYKTIQAKTVPPYDPGKFPNKWRKLEPDRPSRTLMAHLGKDSYSHIHYDSEQARTISVREAARLQSFPDGFIFCGAMNSALKQIGNAVPPLLANILAIKIARDLGITHVCTLLCPYSKIFF